jgi:hypothetical protein
MCYITSQTNKYLDQMEQDEREYEEEFQFIAEFRMDYVANEMENDNLTFVEACNKVEKGLMTLEQLGRLVMTCRNDIIDSMID